MDLDTPLTQSDIVSVHAPLNDNTRHLMNESAFKKMKKSAIFLNLGRGPIVDEQALTDAIINDEIMARGLDVLDVEPMSIENPLRKIKDSEKLIITPSYCMGKYRGEDAAYGNNFGTNQGMGRY